MSSLGGVPLSMRAAHIDYLVSSVNKCLEGTPGFSYVIADKNNLLQSKGKLKSFINYSYFRKIRTFFNVKGNYFSKCCI